jgi:hypothetical protein
MAVRTLAQVKAKFESGDAPRSTDYVDLIDTLAALPDVQGIYEDILLDGGELE